MELSTDLTVFRQGTLTAEQGWSKRGLLVVGEFLFLFRLCLASLSALKEPYSRWGKKLPGRCH